MIFLAYSPVLHLQLRCTVMTSPILSRNALPAQSRLASIGFGHLPDLQLTPH